MSTDMDTKEVERCEKFITQVVEERHRRTGEGIDEPTLEAAVGLLNDIAVNTALLDLIYDGEIVAEFDKQLNDFKFSRKPIHKVAA